MPDGKKKTRRGGSDAKEAAGRKGGAVNVVGEPGAAQAGKPQPEHFGEAALRDALAEFGVTDFGAPGGGNGAQSARAAAPGAADHGEQSPHASVPGAQKEPPPKTVAQIMDEIVWLMTQSPRHKSIPLGDLEWLVMPAILLKQFRMFYSGERPVGVALWALADDAVAKRIDAGDKRLAAAEWKSGTNQRIVDIVAPFGGEAEMRGQVRGENNGGAAPR